jgi:integrase/recombinase XerD
MSSDLREDPFLLQYRYERRINLQNGHPGLDHEPAGPEPVPNTIQAYKDSVSLFLVSSGGTLSRAAIRNFMAELADNGKAPNTQAVRLKAVRQFCRWLLAEGIIDEDPSRTLKSPKTRAVPVKPLTRAEVTAIIAACRSQRDRAIIALLADTGLRIGELASITIGKLDRDEMKVYVLGKGGKWRTVPFSPQAARELNLYLRSRGSDRDELWVGRRGPINRRAVAAVVSHAAARAGIEGVYPHRFRHSFASRWLEEGLSEQGLMKIAGWSSRAMLDRYTAFNAEDRAITEYRKLRP